MGDFSMWHLLLLLVLAIACVVLVPWVLAWVLGKVFPSIKESLYRLLRTYYGVLAGIPVAWLTIALCEYASAAIHPPTGDLRDPQMLAAHIAAAPMSALLLVLAGWTLAAFLGGWVAARIARHRRVAALFIGALVVLGVVANNLMIPHPLWMTIAGIALPIPAAWLAARTHRHRL